MPLKFVSNSLIYEGSLEVHCEPSIYVTGRDVLLLYPTTRRSNGKNFFKLLVYE